MSWRQAQPQRRERRCRRQAGGGGEAPRPLRRRPARRGGERRGPGREHTQQDFFVKQFQKVSVPEGRGAQERRDN
ncbi:hypothetical protein AV530_006147 [Patagioenas fasciata monilis]|uniref:Uncharacterized protein n=1 Tax=Patagioenas fasciata monilis TaxID=372326 RepID=A0A1V4J8C0_PATFA|nr:hypothetical protein AV530_006147 [Patagioenas fasciata monilis]